MTFTYFPRNAVQQSQTTAPDGARVENSIVTLPELVGIGFEGKADLYAEMKALAS